MTKHKETVMKIEIETQPYLIHRRGTLFNAVTGG